MMNGEQKYYTIIKIKNTIKNKKFFKELIKCDKFFFYQDKPPFYIDLFKTILVKSYICEFSLKEKQQSPKLQDKSARLLTRAKKITEVG